MFFLWLATPMLFGCGRQAPEYTIAAPSGNGISIPLSYVNDGGVHFFTYKHEGKNVNFFVRTDGAGKLQTHFDACYSCFKYKRGYVHEGDQVVCIACRIGYDLADIYWDYIGACAPIPINSSVSGDHLTVKLSALEKGKRFF